MEQIKGKKAMSKFNHSVRVPRLYKVAATVAKQYSEGVGGIKQLVYGGDKKIHTVSISLYCPDVKNNDLLNS